MNDSLREKMEDHLMSFPERHKAMMLLIEETRKEHALLKNNQEIMHRVLFGSDIEQKKGIVSMVEEIHVRVIKTTGLVEFLKLTALFGTVTSFLYLLFKKIP